MGRVTTSSIHAVYLFFGHPAAMLGYEFRISRFNLKTLRSGQRSPESRNAAAFPSAFTTRRALIHCHSHFRLLIPNQHRQCGKSDRTNIASTTANRELKRNTNWTLLRKFPPAPKAFSSMPFFSSSMPFFSSLAMFAAGKIQALRAGKKLRHGCMQVYAYASDAPLKLHSA